MHSRRDFLKESGNLSLLLTLPQIKIGKSRGNTITIESEMLETGGSITADPLLQLGENILSKYKTLLSKSAENLILSKDLKTSTNRYTSLFDHPNLTGKIKNGLSNIIVSNAVLYFDLEIIPTTKMMLENIESFLRSSANIEGAGYSIQLVPGSGRIGYKTEGMDLLIINAQILFFYGQSSKWNLSIQLECVPVLLKNKLGLQLYGAPRFFNPDNSPADPIGKLSVKERKVQRAEFVQHLQKEINKVEIEFEAEETSDLSLDVKPKYVLLKDAVRILANSRQVLQKNELIPNPLEEPALRNYRIAAFLSPKYTLQVLTKYLSNQLPLQLPAGYKGYVAVTVFSFDGEASDRARFQISLRVHISFQDWIIDEAEGDAYLHATYELRVIYYGSHTILRANARTTFGGTYEVSGFPPIISDTDSALREFEKEIKAQLAGATSFETRLSTGNEISIFFRNQSIVLLTA